MTEWVVGVGEVKGGVQQTVGCHGIVNGVRRYVLCSPWLRATRCLQHGT